MVAAMLVASAGTARAEPTCLAGPADDPFPICFDPGRRLVVGAELTVTEDGERPGGSASLAFRHVVTTDDPAVWWRLEHVVLDTRWRGDALDVAIYRGRFLRHSRDGRIVLPTSPPRKIFLPFDVGAEADVGAIASIDGGDRLEVGVVRIALLVDLLRSETFRRRLTVGAAGRWDLAGSVGEGDPSAEEHRVAPFTVATAALHLESENGLTLVDLAGEGGRTWSTVESWRSAWSASGTLERVVVAVNDWPVSLYAQAGYADTGRGAFAALGIRLGVVASPSAPR